VDVASGATTGATALTAPGTTGVAAATEAAGAGAPPAAEAAGPLDGAGLAVPEPVPVAVAPLVALAGELGAVEVTADTAELTVEATGDAAELTVEVTGDTAELTTEVTGDAAELMAEVTAGAVEVCVGVRGGSAAVAACAGRENISMIAKIPAAASAACTATRAMRRATGCSISSSHSTRNQAAHLPPAAATNLVCLDLLFGHHRTVSSPIGQEQAIQISCRGMGSSYRRPNISIHRLLR
jgi:hypothetical protein